MNKLYVILIVLPIILINISEVSSINCYHCESKDGSDKDCEEGLSTMAKKPCKNDDPKEPSFCFKINGTGFVSNVQTFLRGCHSESVQPYKNYTSGNQFDYTSPINTDYKYKLVGRLYTCDSNLCNPSTDLKNSFILLISFAGLSVVISFKSQFNIV